MLRFQHLNQQLVLLAQKAIYWENQKALLIADPHFGKVTHFRKAGIAIPSQAAHKNIEVLKKLIHQYKPQDVIFLGDLFHSEMNTEWLAFKDLLKDFPQINFTLIQGNHDILPLDSYQKSTLKLVQELNLGPYNFTHEPKAHTTLYNLSGHIHPGVRMYGKGKQSMRFPCYYFGNKTGILPAYGQFTGLHTLSPQQGDKVFIITRTEVQQVL